MGSPRFGSALTRESEAVVAPDYPASRKGISGITQLPFILTALVPIQMSVTQRPAWTGWTRVKAC